MKNYEIGAENLHKKSDENHEIGFLARNLDKLTIRERMSVTKTTAKKIFIALVGYVIAIMIMVLLL